MFVKDLVEFTVQRFKTRALRVFLTTFGIGIGIAIVFFLVSLGFGLQELVIGRIATSDSLLALEITGSSEQDALIKVNKNSLDEISKIEGVEEYSPLVSTQMQITYKEVISQTVVQGVSANYFRLAGIETSEGEFFNDDDINKVIVTNAVLTLFEIPPEEAIGQELNLSKLEDIATNENTKTEADNTTETQTKTETADTSQKIEQDKKVVIGGVIEDQNNFLFANIKIFDNYEELNYNSARIKVANKEIVEPIKKQVQELGYQVTALTDTLEQLNKVFSATQAMFAAFGIVALFISAVGMFNTMTISLLERTKEIGIMRAIGATKGDIWQMFLIEALVIGFLGGVLGLALGYLATQLVNILLNQVAVSFGGEKIDLFVTPSWFILLIIVFSLLVGFLTGLFPAKRASKIDPLKALRYE